MRPPRNQARIQRTLVELQQRTQTTKPLQSAEKVDNMAKEMPVVISLDSDSDSQEDVIELSDSDESVVDTLSSDDSYVVMEDEDGVAESEAESENEGESCQHRKEDPSTSSPAGELLDEEVTRQIRSDHEKTLTIDNCRSYLRNNALRVTGAKPVLIARIKLHMRLKEGGCRDYDRSTFIFNCKGDVCTGDVVMFDQMVYTKYDVSSQRGASVGRRTIAGRVVKESYGAQRQQHTFTVEVLWSSGCKPLPLLKQLLVKGRNLYKRKTFRQRWADEGERMRILDEKHARGAAARHVRATKHRRIRGYATARLDVQQMTQLASPHSLRPSFESRPWQQGSPDRLSGFPQGFPCPPASFELRPSHQKAHKRPIAIPCPTAGCRNSLSKYCSSGVCYNCCKNNGGKCSKHKR